MTTASMSRLQSNLADCIARSRKAMGIFVTCGFPSIDLSVPIMRAIENGGADFVELGMPFSDPLAEGKPIQRSSATALQNGVTLETVFATCREYRTLSDKPLLLMGYANPVYRFGVEAFCRRAVDEGVDGLILPDLPPEEAGALRAIANQVGLNLIFLIAPTTPDERMRQIDSLSTGFVYAVSFTGLTGDKIQFNASVSQYLSRARRAVSNPLIVGFGIRSRDDAVRMTRDTDGFIVGSALVSVIENAGNRDSILADVESFVSSLRA